VPRRKSRPSRTPGPRVIYATFVLRRKKKKKNNVLRREWVVLNPYVAGQGGERSFTSLVSGLGKGRLFLMGQGRRQVGTVEEKIIPGGFSNERRPRVDNRSVKPYHCRRRGKASDTSPLALHRVPSLGVA